MFDNSCAFIGGVFAVFTCHLSPHLYAACFFYLLVMDQDAIREMNEDWAMGTQMWDIFSQLPKVLHHFSENNSLSWVTVGL